MYVSAQGKARADYQWKLADVDGERTLLIVDHNLGGMSVTNDAEAVLAEISEQLLSPISEYRVIYRDSEGQWDEICLDQEGMFDCFKAGPRDGQHAAAWAVPF